MTGRTRRITAALLIPIAVMAGAGIWFWPRPVQHSIDYKMPGNPGPKIAAAEAAAIERRERVIDQTIWKKEMEAEEYGRVFEDFWDGLNAATNKWSVVKAFKFDSIEWPDFQPKETLPHAIQLWLPKLGHEKPESPHVDSYQSWIEKAEAWEADGWRIMQCEFRHNAFDPQTNDSPAKSIFYFSAHLTNAASARAVIEGDVMVHWHPRDSNAPLSIQRIDGSRLRFLSRLGSPAFAEIRNEILETPPLSGVVEPLIVYDLDGDGIPEIVLPALNRIYRWRRDHYEIEKFCTTERLQILNGLFADFDGDGITDFLFVEFEGIFLLKGSANGRFNIAPRALTSKMDWFGPRAITCGDIDGDGDLDVFVGQYKGPFTQGSMPTPYYDANDGYPSSLFLNDGAGNLTEASQQIGFGLKRFRRVYSASFVDLDADGALDLVVASDFAGVDVYHNDGHGKFTDVTNEWLDEPHAFGMGLAFGDFNSDGRLDFFVSGMTSATAERLEHLGLQRPLSRLDSSMRGKMIYGSRLFLQDSTGRFSGGQLAHATARTGWSWGVAAADFDNDGLLDLYVANGMESMTKVRDYEREFWLHDIFVAGASGTEATRTYFSVKGANRRRASESFGGFDKNRLYLNHAAEGFVDIAHLMGVAVEDDCRNLVAADLNADGKMDLVFTSQHAGEKPFEKLHIFRNDIRDTGNWIAFSFRDEPGHRSPIGTQILLHSASGSRVAALLTGDSFRSQQPSVVRFGLGIEKVVESAEIKRPGGAVTRLAGPEINRTHWISAPMR